MSDKFAAWERQEHAWKVNGVDALPRTAFMAGYEAAERRECVWTYWKGTYDYWDTSCGRTRCGAGDSPELEAMVEEIRRLEREL